MPQNGDLSNQRISIGLALVARSEVRSGACDSPEPFAKLNGSGCSRSARRIGEFRIFFSIHETATHLAQCNNNFGWYVAPKYAGIWHQSQDF
jgi:hypothetical protein